MNEPPRHLLPARILKSKLLAPDIVEAIPNGRLLAELGLPALMEPIPAEWERQRLRFEMQS